MHLHEKRGVTFAELGALLGTRALLTMKGMTHTRACSVPGGKHTFRMDIGAQTDNLCGTASCIGGTMGLILFTGAVDRASRFVAEVDGSRPPSPFQDLFYPHVVYHSMWYEITPQHAVAAIDNWLKTGKPRWEKVLPSKFLKGQAD